MGKRELNGKITENRQIADGVFQMTIAAANVGFRPGQFFMIAAGATIRRAFAPMRADADGFAFAYALVGAGTENLSKLLPDATVNIIAPLGNGYAIDRQDFSAAILVGGGVGAPSLLFLAQVLRGREIETNVILGGRSAKKIVAATEFAPVSTRLLIATDDGSAGIRGNVIAALAALDAAKLARARIFACGPQPMLRAVGDWAREKKIACQVSIEERMGCGIGACMGCVAAIKNLTAPAHESKYQRVCVEGPVFDAETIDWDNA